MSDKTKAVALDRQWLVQNISYLMLAGLALVVKGAGNYGEIPVITDGGIPPSITAAMARFHTVLQICNSRGGCSPMAHTPNLPKSWEISNRRKMPLILDWPGKGLSCVGIHTQRIYCQIGNFLSGRKSTCYVSDFSSIPRDCSSLRIIRLIHADTDASPSSASACLMPSSKPGSTRSAICLLPLPLISMVDIWLTPDYFEMVVKCMTGAYQKATPRSAGTLPRRLTKPLIEVTVMADIQSTQTHPKFTWRFLALSASTRSVIHITAATEREAREQSPVGCVMVFAARLSLQGVRHA